jgi:hypothetical protein
LCKRINALTEPCQVADMDPPQSPVAPVRKAWAAPEEKVGSHGTTVYCLLAVLPGKGLGVLNLC